MKRLLPVSMAIALTLLAGSSDAWAKADGPAAVARPGDNATGSKPAAAARAAGAASLDPSYASREARAKGLEKFEGGDVVVISGTTLIIVLLVILILVVA